jgi:integrase
MYKRGNAWYSDFWYEGERYTKSHGAVSKSIAKEKDIKFYNEVASGEYTKNQKDPPFDKAIDDHLKWSKKNNKPKTYLANTFRAKHLKAFFGNRKLSRIQDDKKLMEQFIEIRKAEIKAYQLDRGRETEEISYTTINRELALMRKMFNEMIKDKYINVKMNPVSLVDGFEEIEKERILTPDEVNKILAEIEKADRRYKHIKDIIIVGLNTAMRMGEILGMEKIWIDLEAGIINVPRHSQKRGKKVKRVPVNFVIRPILSRLLKQNKDSIYLFVNPKTKKPYTSIQNAWDTILDKAGISGKPHVDKLRLHDLRHTCATNLARAGKDIKLIAQYLGHADVKTTARYIHYQDEDLKEAAEILGRSSINFHNSIKAVRVKP